MEQHVCTCCGSQLKHKENEYVCPYCGAVYEDDYEQRAAYTLKELLDEAKIESLANAVRRLYEAAHKKYPSKDEVVNAASAVLQLNPNNLLAKMYIASHEFDPMNLNLLLASAQCSPAEAKEIVRWLLPSLSPRTVGALHDFVDRHFQGEERTKIVTQVEEEANKLENGIYEPGIPREVFLCYSSSDMPKVMRILDLLEQNGLACFAAFRNLRHGKGSADNYLVRIKEAMEACKVFVFLSSKHSRATTCDAVTVELPYLISALPDKPRVEFILEDYDASTPYLVKKTLKAAFPEQEHCRDEEDLLDRVSAIVESLKPKTQEPKKQEKPSKPKEEVKAAPVEEEGAEPNNVDFQILGNAVIYGEYPQSQVLDKKLLNALPNAPRKPGSPYIVYQGKKYAEYNGYYFNVDPLRWRIAKMDESQAILYSEYIIDVLPFDKKSVNFGSSSLKQWLNLEFIQMAFPDGGSRLVSKFLTPRVGLLSVDEIEGGYPCFTDDSVRKAPRSVFAQAKEGSGDYWLSTSLKYYNYWGSRYMHGVAFVDSNGRYDNLKAYNPNTKYTGVRPRIVVKLK